MASEEHHHGLAVTNLMRLKSELNKVKAAGDDPSASEPFCCVFHLFVAPYCFYA